MQQIISSLIHFDRSKVDIAKGIWQRLLTTLPVLIGCLLGFPMFGILISTDTLAYVYVFSGSPQSMLKTVITCLLSSVICTIFGTLTMFQPILFGLLLLVVVTILCYTFNALKIAGPPSTSFLAAFRLSINSPIAPGEALLRGSAILIGGILATITVVLIIMLAKEKVEDRAIHADFETLHNLLHHFNEPEDFKAYTRNAVTEFRNSERLLITSTPGGNGKLSKRFQELILLHISAQGIYSELLGLNENHIRSLPSDLIGMVDRVINSVQQPRQQYRPWSEVVDVTLEFQNLMGHALKIDEMIHANDNQIKCEADTRKPLYSKQIY